MSRLLAAALLLVTQILAVFGTGNLVLCVHGDGAYAIEMAGSACCRAAHRDEDARARAPAGGAAVASADTDPCRDVPYHHEQVPVVRASRVQAAPAVDVRAAAPVLFAAAQVQISIAPFTALAASRGPPREPVPRAARPFVLRC